VLARELLAGTGVAGDTDEEPLILAVELDAEDDDTPPDVLGLARCVPDPLNVRKSLLRAATRL
jgi:hypothetical protein